MTNTEAVTHIAKKAIRQDNPMNSSIWRGEIPCDGEHRPDGSE